MYQLTEKHIDHILNDIRARGVEMESLQQNLLDHICCIIEQNLEENGDFETFYQRTICTFYKDELWEIEEETLSLLIFKHYYTMKKIMILSGLACAVTMVIGLCFKFMHWPGASTVLTASVLTGSFVFLPLLFTLKAKEKQKTKDKVILAAGALAATLVSLSFLFRVQHLPHSVTILYISAFVMLLIFLPVYFFSGVRNPETKVNTIASSVLIIMAYGLLLLMVRTPTASHIIVVKQTQDFLRSQHILNKEKQQLELKSASPRHGFHSELGNSIYQACEDLKSRILETETGSSTIGEDFENRGLFVKNQSYSPDDASTEKLQRLSSLIVEYNIRLSKDKEDLQISSKASFMDDSKGPGTGLMLSTTELLNQLTQIQMMVLQNERELMASVGKESRAGS